MKRTEGILMLLAGATVGLTSLPASASGNYPSGVATKLGLASAPQCLLCHTSPGGGADTVKQPFGLTAKKNGLSGGGNAGALTAALNAMETANTDSDGDSVGDIAELKAGTNPNVPDNASTVRVDGGTAPAPATPESPSYGCGANMAGQGPSPGGAASTLALGLAVLGLRRRRTG